MSAAKRAFKTIVPAPGLFITGDARLAPGIHHFGGADGIIIEADDIVVDGAGAVLRGGSHPPALPDGDHLYTPGDLGISREEHSLLVRKITLPADGTVVFECKCWGAADDPAVLEISRDRQAWTKVAPAGGERAEQGWQVRRWQMDAAWRGELSLKFVVPENACLPGAPLFYDAFRILHDGREIWLGDARGNWKSWYNTGFSIFKREQKRFYAGVAIRATGRRGVTLRNFRVEGFLTGLWLTDCSGWTIEGNDFTSNYDDPDYGWGEGKESHGAIFLDRVSSSTLRKNRGARVWNGIAMRRSSHNTIVDNEFSHCSNVCLKMAQSSDNLVRDNVLSWGIRIYPGEVHARDSVSLLIESGSDRNRFLRNDLSHGGDGIFIRVLNHWCSSGNLFEENDCSHANNNAVESWSPGNTYIRNKASWSSYGFWLGGSDDTVLIDNEVLHNGEAHQNAPEPFGHAGISVVHGSSTNFVMAGNLVSDNRGCGLSLAWTEQTPARHWLVAGNHIRRSRNDPRGYKGHGVLAELCSGVSLLGNRIEGNEGTELVIGRSCHNVMVDPAPCRVVRGLEIDAPIPVMAGTEVTLTVAGQAGLTEFAWDFNDGAGVVTNEPSSRHIFAEPGRRRVTVTCRGPGRAGIASHSICIVPGGRQVADCSALDGWSLAAGAAAGGAGAGSAPGAATGTLEVDPARSVLGRGALLATVRAGATSTLSHRFAQPQDMNGIDGISFFYRYVTELFFIVANRIRTVGVALCSGPSDRLEYIPEYPAQGMPSEDRYDWVWFAAPLGRFHPVGKPSLSSIQSIDIIFGPELPADCMFRIDALSARKARA